jgi:5-methylcytosine-specific restriction endonuclease McrA
MASYGAQFQKNKKTVAKLNIEKYGDYTCELCGRSPLYPGTGDRSDRAKELQGILLTVDHKLSLRNGGKNGLYNLQVSCNKCNKLKGHK